VSRAKHAAKTQPCARHCSAVSVSIDMLQAAFSAGKKRSIKPGRRPSFVFPIEMPPTAAGLAAPRDGGCGLVLKLIFSIDIDIFIIYG